MKFQLFDVLSESDNYIFLSSEIDDPKKLATLFFNYFFDEQRVFNYFKCLEENIVFEPSKRNYAELYKNISYFFDSSEDISNDKAGKLGEYFLSTLLLDFFKFDCIIPKLIHITDQKMPIYGIDTLFYSTDYDLLMYGESKFSNSLYDGIKLIESSLDKYEDQFEDEFRYIVLNKGFTKSKNKKLAELGEISDMAINFNEFLKLADISHLGIPLFICHGSETDCEEIMRQLKNIEKPSKIMNLKIKYIVVSLPINDKTEFLKSFKKELVSKHKEYLKLYEAS